MTPRIPLNEPQTETGRDMLNDLRVMWGNPAWASFPWGGTIAAIEREAQAIPLIDRQRLNDEYMRGYNAASLMLDSLLTIERGAIPLIDVDLLAEALQSAMTDDEVPMGERPRAVQVAAEYARLASESSTAAPRAPSDSWRDTGNRGAAEHAARQATRQAAALPVKEGEPE